MEGKWHVRSEHVCSMSKDYLIQRKEILTYHYILPLCEGWTMNTEQLILMYLFIFSLVLALNLVAQSYILFCDHKTSRQT